MNKVSSIVKTQATTQFNQKRKEVIHNTLRKIANEKGKSFEEILQEYMN